MILHLGYEIPAQVPKVLDHESSDLTAEEVRILKSQIRKNGEGIRQYIERLDLLVNQEGYPAKAVFVQKIRRRLELLMEENDTFRKVLWKHYLNMDLLEGVTRC